MQQANSQPADDSAANERVAGETSKQIEQQQQHHEQNNGPNCPANSPRRKKPPLNLDAALYLQSTASYVQEPNTTSRASPGSGASNSRGSSSNLVRQQQQQQQQLGASYSNQFSFGAEQRVAASLDNVYDLPNNYYYSSFSRNNISVDYIDCVSNNDLVEQNVNSQTGGDRTMRAIRHCRKHLRFHRNRVEPGGNNTSTTTAATTTTTTTTTTTSNGDLPTTELEACSSSAGDASSINLAAGQEAGASCLYPISVSEVKKRTYFIGSVAQDSLLGHDELHRYFPNGRVSIFVCTWNQNRKRAPMNLNDLLLPEQLVYMPDIYAIGIQEAFSSQTDHLREWEIELQTTLGPNHVLLHSCSLGVLHLSLFVRRDLIWFCSTPEESVYNSRSMPTNMIKTKGAVSIAFRFFGTSIMFTNCHFPAHENKLKDRIDEYQRIINSIDLPKNLKLLKPRYLSNDSTARFDCVFFMGDLNFRLEQRSFDETIHILDDIFQQKDRSYEILTQNDELLKVMETNQAFNGFDESQIKFPPTYKFLAQTNKYDRQTKRVPSYTDRILFRSKRQRHIQCLLYDWLPQLLSSDHKPVYCLFDVLIRPGHERNMVTSLNAGLFQRTVYLEALKRRAEDPDSMRENGAGGSLICTIS